MSVDQTILEKHGIKEINVETDQSIREKKMEKDNGKGGGTETLNISSSQSEGNCTDTGAASEGLRKKSNVITVPRGKDGGPKQTKMSGVMWWVKHMFLRKCREEQPPSHKVVT